MTEIKFPAHADRKKVATMLEGPVRANDLPAIQTVLDELDRIDAVEAAERRIRVVRYQWEQEAIAAGVTIEPAEKGAKCVTPSYSRYSYHKMDGKTHAAKVRLNGTAYCGTHLKNAQEKAERKAVREAARFVPDPADAAIIQADRDLVAQRLAEEKEALLARHSETPDAEA